MALNLVNLKESFFQRPIIFFIVFSFKRKLYLFSLYIFCKAMVNSCLLYTSVESKYLLHLSI